MTVSFDVTNTGSREGVDTPQLYVATEGGARRLAGWSRLSLAPGQTRRVSITAEPRVLAEWDTTLPGWRLGGQYRFTIGKTAADDAVATQATVQPRTIRP